MPYPLRVAVGLCALVLAIPFGLVMAATCIVVGIVAMCPWVPLPTIGDPAVIGADDSRWMRRQADVFSTN
jgi:hypothetical protein